MAPAVIFYSVYECGSDDEDTATAAVDTSAAGANVLIADGTINHVTGSYVARIYDPDSVVLSEDGTEVTDSDKLHKYDGAFYSRMSMNVDGGEAGTGVLNITADNEGLDTELHLTINGGTINITSGNDGINTNEDNVSVTTINGGSVNIQVTGETGEGDGIDSNGYLVINGGAVNAAACSSSGDAASTPAPGSPSTAARSWPPAICMTPSTAGTRPMWCSPLPPGRPAARPTPCKTRTARPWAPGRLPMTSPAWWCPPRT